MTIKLYIISGASRGMGLAMARQLIAPDHLLLGISRRQNAQLQDEAAAAGCRLEQWAMDLADPLPVAQALQAWLARQDATALSLACLINNAGVITPPGPVDAVPLADLSNALRVGLEATVLLSAAFLHGSRGWTASDRRVLNISSGLGRRAMAGSAPYCAAKAGMDNFSRAVALDEQAQHGAAGARIVSLAPGIIDTDMQAQLRGGDPAHFPDQPRFAAFKSEGQLDSPAAAAAKVLRYLARADFGSTVLGDVRDA